MGTKVAMKTRVGGSVTVDKEGNVKKTPARKKKVSKKKTGTKSKGEANVSES
jgi:hypothetical protein